MSDKLLPNDMETAEFVEIDGADFEDISDIQRDVDSQMNLIFQEFGGDNRDTEFKIHVKRAMRDKAELEHCFSCLPADLPILDRIKDEFGSGAYQIWIYKDGKIFRRRAIHIAEAIKKPDHTGKDLSSNLSQLIQTVSETQQRTVEQVQSIVQSQLPPRPEFDIKGILAAAVPVIGIIKELIPPKANEMDTFLKAAEFMKSVSPDNHGSGSESNFYDMMGSLAKSFGPGIMDMSAKLAAQQTQQGHHPNPPIPAQNTPALSQPQPENKPMDQNIVILRQQLKMLVGMASQDKDPALYGDLIMDQVPEEMIHAYILRADYMAFLVSIEPTVAQYQPWFVALHDTIAGYFIPDDLTTGQDSAIKEGIVTEGAISEAGESTTKNQAVSDIAGDTGREGRDTGNAQDHVPVDQGGEKKIPGTGESPLTGSPTEPEKLVR